MKKQPKSDIMAAVHETAQDLHAAGVLPMGTLREFDELCRVNETGRHARKYSLRGTPLSYREPTEPAFEDWRQGLENDIYE